MTDTPANMLNEITATEPRETADNEYHIREDFSPPEAGAAFLNALQTLALAEMAPTETDPPLGQPVRILIAAQKLIVEFDNLAETVTVFLKHPHRRLLLEIMLYVQRLKEAKDFLKIFEHIGDITSAIDTMSALDLNQQFKKRTEQKPEWTPEMLNSWFETIRGTLSSWSDIEYEV